MYPKYGYNLSYDDFLLEEVNIMFSQLQDRWGSFLCHDELPPSPTPTPYHDVYFTYPFNTHFGKGSEKYMIISFVLVIVITALILFTVHLVKKNKEKKG